MFEPCWRMEWDPWRKQIWFWGYGFLFGVQRPLVQYHVYIGTSAVTPNIHSFKNSFGLDGHCTCTVFAWPLCWLQMHGHICYFFKLEVEVFKFRGRIIFNMNSYKWKPTLSRSQDFCLPLWGDIVAKKTVFLFLFSFFFFLIDMIQI